MQIVGAATGASVPGKSIHSMQASLPYQLLPNVPMAALHGIVTRPLPGADAVLMFHENDPSNAVCIGVNDPRYHLPDLPDGCVGVAHHLGASILFYTDRIEVQGAAAPIRLLNCADIDIKTSTRVRIEGNLEVTGEVMAHADSGAVHLSTHQHSGVQGGTGTSSEPVAGS